MSKDVRNPVNTHVEWLRLLKQIGRVAPKSLDPHLIADSYATHKPEGKGLARAASALQNALHADEFVLAQSGRALLRRP